MALIKSSTDIKVILTKFKTIAVVGLSAKTSRTSHNVSKYMLNNGYRIIPVNPNYSNIFDEVCYPSLNDIDEEIDIVNIFRKSQDVMPVVEAAVKTDAKVIWMQLGIINHDAAELAVSSGLDVIMDRCIKIEHSSLIQ